MIATVLATVLWTAPVALPAEPDATWFAIGVPGWLEAFEAGDLGSVRLLDASGVEIPYRLVDPSGFGEETWFTPTVLNLVADDGGFSAELLNPQRRQVDRLRVHLGDGEGVLEVAVALRSGPSAGRELVDGVNVGRLQGLAVTDVMVPVTDEVRLAAHGRTVLPGWTIRGFELHVHGPVAPRVTGVVTSLEVSEGASEGGWQAWNLTLPETRRLQALLVDVADPPVFRRASRVLGWDVAAGGWRPVGEGVLARVPTVDGREGLTQRRVELAPGAFARLRLLVARGDERPLVLEGVSGSPAQRYILFPAGGLDRPVHLERGSAPRSRSLEVGPAVDLRNVAVADAGSRIGLPDEAPQLHDPAAGPDLGDLLFVVAAVLLGLLAWRVLARRPVAGGEPPPP